MRILIADDHGIVRNGLHAMFDAESDIDVIGEAMDGAQVVQMAAELSPDVIIMDITMPNLNGIEATRQILENNPKTRIVALSVHAEKHIVKEMLSAGAAGYVLKTYLYDELSRAIHAVMESGYYLSPRVADTLVADYVARGPQPVSENLYLTDRERKVIQFVAEGKTIKQIAYDLDLSPKTIDADRRKIMDKLNVISIAELTKYAIREGLTPLQ